MKKIDRKETLGDVIVEGLKEAVAWAKGQITLRRIDVELPEPAPMLAAKQIVELRAKLGFSQVVFAMCMNVSVKAVQAWEQGLRVPDGPALRLMDLAGAQPTLFKRMVRVAPLSVAGRGSRGQLKVPRRRRASMKKAA